MKIVAENGTHKIVAIDKVKGWLIQKAFLWYHEEKERVVLLADAEYEIEKINEMLRCLREEANQELKG